MLTVKNQNGKLARKVKKLAILNVTSVLWCARLKKVSRLDTIQDSLIELDMKPRMHIVEINTFSINNVTVRITKIMNNLLKWVILIFKVISHL